MAEKKEEKKDKAALLLIPFALAIPTGILLWLRHRGATETATLYGVITDLVTGDPLPNVRVSIDSRIVYSDSSGYYELKTVTPSDYTVTFEKDNFRTESGQFTLAAGNNVLNFTMEQILFPIPDMEVIRVEEFTHHGDVEEWSLMDLDGAGASWILDSNYYVSPPTGLRLSIPVGSTAPRQRRVLFMNNDSEALNLKQGMLICWQAGNHPIFAGYRPTVGFVFGFSGPELFRTNVRMLSANLWHKFRLIWWNAIDFNNDPKLAVRVDEFIDGAWVEGDIEYQDRLSGDLNMVGLWGYDDYNMGTRQCYFDDFEIWKPVVA